MSDFGAGVIYNLVLFAMHAEREFGEECLWFEAAYDHLKEMNVPSNLPVELQEKMIMFIAKVFSLRHTSYPNAEPTEEDREWALREVLEIAFLIDQFYGNNPIRATFT